MKEDTPYQGTKSEAGGARRGVPSKTNTGGKQMSEMPKKIWAYRGNGDDVTSWFWIEDYADESETEYVRADLVGEALTVERSEEPMPWRLQIAAMIVAASIAPLIETRGEFGVDPKTALKQTDALIAEHERTKADASHG